MNKAWFKLLLSIALIVSTAYTALATTGPVKVINHLFTTDVVQDAKGNVHPQDTLVGFSQGVASFHTLTQVALDQGTHQLTMALRDPAGNTVAAKSLPAITAAHADWVETLWVRWSNVPLERTGRYELILSLKGQVVARFYLPVS